MYSNFFGPKKPCIFLVFSTFYSHYILERKVRRLEYVWFKLKWIHINISFAQCHLLWPFCNLNIVSLHIWDTWGWIAIEHCSILEVLEMKAVRHYMWMFFEHRYTWERICSFPRTCELHSVELHGLRMTWFTWATGKTSVTWVTCGRLGLLVELEIPELPDAGNEILELQPRPCKGST